MGQPQLFTVMKYKKIRQLTETVWIIASKTQEVPDQAHDTPDHSETHILRKHKGNNLEQNNLSLID